jgi:hypothetical protein
MDEAVKFNGINLMFVPSHLRHRGLCIIAVQKSPSALRYVPKEHLDYGMCLIAVSSHGCSLQHVPRPLVTEELCMAAVKNRSKAVKYVPFGSLSREFGKKISLIAVRESGLNLQYIDPKQPYYSEICDVALEQNGAALEFVADELQTPQMIKMVVSRNGCDLRYVPRGKCTSEVIQHVHPHDMTVELCEMAVSSVGAAFEHVPDQFKTYKMCVVAVSWHWYMLKFVPEDLKTLDICNIAVKMSKDALQYTPKKYYKVMNN